MGRAAFNGLLFLTGVGLVWGGLSGNLGPMIAAIVKPQCLVPTSLGTASGGPSAPAPKNPNRKSGLGTKGPEGVPTSQT